MVLIYHKQKRELKHIQNKKHKHKQKIAKWDQSFLNPYLNQKENSATSKSIRMIEKVTKRTKINCKNS